MSEVPLYHKFGPIIPRVLVVDCSVGDTDIRLTGVSTRFFAESSCEANAVVMQIALCRYSREVSDERVACI